MINGRSKQGAISSKQMIPPSIMSPNGLICSSAPRSSYIPDHQLSTQSMLDRPLNSGCKRCCLGLFVVAYLVFFVSMQIVAHAMDADEEIGRRPNLPRWAASFIEFVGTPYYFCLVYIPLINFLLFILVGRYVLSAILFPYQNSVIRETLDRNNSAKFGEEFSHQLDSLVYTLRIQAGQDVKGEMLASLHNMTRNEGKKKSPPRLKSTMDKQEGGQDPKRNASTANTNQQMFTESDIPYNFLSFQEVRNLVELLSLYIGVN